MDDARFDAATRWFATALSRRALLAPLVGLGLGASEGAARRRSKACRPACGACARCRTGRCRPKRNGARCGGTGQCRNETCRCPAGSKDCRGRCIPDEQCCGGCPEGRTCCENVGDCKDLRNDFTFCGRCANAACAGAALCFNGQCGLTCTIGQPCFTGCTCTSRADAAHPGATACAGLGAGTCATATTCASDADCGFARVCVSGLCPPFNVCASPCA